MTAEVLQLTTPLLESGNGQVHIPERRPLTRLDQYKKFDELSDRGLYQDVLSDPDLFLIPISERLLRAESMLSRKRQNIRDALEDLRGVGLIPREEKIDRTKKEILEEEERRLELDYNRLIIQKLEQLRLSRRLYLKHLSR